MKKSIRALFVFTTLAALIILPVALFSAPASGQKEAAVRGGGCLSCHKGIEIINAKMAKAWGADKKCEVCHGGNPSAATKIEAHDGLIANPGDLRVIDRTCGKCHSDYGTLSKVKIQGIDNHVGRVVRSLMATAAGEIAGTRYLWGEQETRSAIYGVRAVADPDREMPDGAVDHLIELPPSSHSDADSLLRGACLKCHLWTEDKTGDVFRPAGCSACHVPYASDGLSRSGDPSISKTEPGHARVHVITTKVSDEQCLLCHNNGGARIGLSYTGLAVSDPSMGLSDEGPGGFSAYGASLMHVQPDVHFRRSMACIDCHDTVDLHGDGNIYSHQEDQVGIRCESCHGTASEPPSFRTERGRKLGNIETGGQGPYLRGKISGKKHPIPLLLSKDTGGAEGVSDSPDPAGSELASPADIGHSGHQRLECYACHSKRVQQCYACHMVRDDRTSSPVDWGLGIGEGQAAEPSPGSWKGRKLLQLWEEPVLGLNKKGRVSPMMPGGQAILTHLDADGETIERNRTFTTSSGLYGFSTSPIQPHNISKGSRSCQSCHSSKKALGLGSGLIDLRRLGLPLSFSPDRIVDEDGVRIQDSAHEAARPFNGEELAGLLRTKACVVCHEKAPKLRDGTPHAPPTSIMGADKRHHESMKEMLEPRDN
jgi:hypothetical protein